MKSLELGIKDFEVGLEEITPWNWRVCLTPQVWALYLKNLISLHVFLKAVAPSPVLSDAVSHDCILRAVMFRWACLSPSEVTELQSCHQELNPNITRLHIVKSVQPPSLMVMRQKRARIQQGCQERGKKCVKVKLLVQNAETSEHGVPGEVSWQLPEGKSWVLH